MSLGDFIMYFDHINISKVNLGYRNSYVTNEASRYSFYQNKVIVKSKGDYYFTLYQENPRKYRSSGSFEKSKSWMFLAKIDSFTESGSISKLTAIASSTSSHRDNTIETTLEPGAYVILSSVTWNYWESHHYTITSYGPDKVAFNKGEVASEILLGQFVESEGEKITLLGGSSTGIYRNSQISKSFFFDHQQGIGFISITNQDVRMIELKVRLEPCVGITILAPHSLPLQLTVMPFEKVTACFIVDPRGYNYRMHESYKLYDIGNH